MHAKILIGIHLIPLADNESLEGPVAFPDAKFLATGIFEFVQAANDDFLNGCVGQSAGSVVICRTTIIERMIDGMPSAAA
jgi:hypothetical protein